MKGSPGKKEDKMNITNSTPHTAAGKEESTGTRNKSQNDLRKIRSKSWNIASIINSSLNWK